MFFSLLNVVWMIVAVDGYRRRSYVPVASVVVWHLVASYLVRRVSVCVCVGERERERERERECVCVCVCVSVCVCVYVVDAECPCVCE
jgi:hypothetical protein